MTVHVRVPATSANLGPGFDALGIALTLTDEITADVTNLTKIEVSGEGAGVVPLDESHLVATTMRRTFTAMGVPQPAGLHLRCRNAIPHARGLGSSAAATVAGVLAARALHPGGTEAGTAALPDEAVLELATEVEGHPDNVAPCLAGGLTIAWNQGGTHSVRLDVDPRLQTVVFVPPDGVATRKARGALPGTVPHSDAAFNAGRAALLVAALTGAADADVLLPATADRLHQRYRASMMPESAELVERLRNEGVPAAVSGAGPTVIAFTTGDRADLTEREAGRGWHIKVLNVDPLGACVQRAGS